jgi:hypothetical protein
MEREQLDGENRHRVLREIWLQELAKRRLVWCWHAAKGESMAQWQIYAHKGVAIRSTPAAVVEALGDAGAHCVQAFVVRYLPDSECPSGEHLLTRPYSFKRDSFGYENEIRFVMSIPSLEGQKGLCLSGIDTDFIEEIVVSPFCIQDEAYTLVELLRGFFRKKGKVPLIRCSEQRSAPTTSTFLKELLKTPDNSALEASEAGIPELLRRF